MNTSYLSHRLRAVSQPLLYSALFLYTDNVAVDTPPTALERLLRTLLTPGGGALATFANSLTLRWGHGRNSRATDREADYPHRFVEDTALLSSMPSAAALRELVQNTQVLLLLSLLRRLRTFKISIDLISAASFESFVAELMTTLGTPPRSPSAFGSLRSIEYSPRHPSSGMNGDSLIVLLQLPLIDSLNIALNLTGRDLRSYPMGGTSSVTKLHLWNNGIGASELATILQTPRQLTHFSCDAPCDTHFGQAMSRLQASLQQLTLTSSEHDGELCEIGSLRAWAELQSLRCRLEHLLGDGTADHPLRLVDVLPRRIRTLEIVLHPSGVRRLWRVVSETVALLQRKEEVVPALREVRIDLDPGQKRADVLRACVAARVSFRCQTYAGDGCCYDAPM